ncbi:MAG: YidC/Oxa1 family membrane protein insertase [Clostridia bacterium]|nr:YidC/Oxa1 family membrane protein insertase [Clostridia bacterium]
MLETLLIGPLKLVFEILFHLALNVVQNPGFAIIILSLCMNFLVLPLYKRADAMQEEARDMENKLREGTAHIKKTFRGDERMMILQTYHRQNHYKPTDVFKGSVSLLLEIPFFMAAYQFLSHLEALNGVSFGPIADLGRPDGIITLFGISWNLLPILMTLINVISSAIYLKGFPLKTKIQLYAMALFFLFFLYTSPAGLVFYWTLNNVFSLVKNVFYKLKNPKKVLKLLAFLCGAAFLVLFFLGKGAILGAIGVILLLPALLPLIRRILPRKKSADPTPNRGFFVSGTLFLTLFVGLFIPATYLAASPQEYVDVTYFHHPLWFLLSSGLFAAGLFLVWFGVFYWLAGPKGKVVFERIVFIAALCGTVNYLFFGTSLGVISPTLQYEGGMNFEVSELRINLLVTLLVTAAAFLIAWKWKRFSKGLLATASLAFALIITVQSIVIAYSVSGLGKLAKDNTPHFELSRNGQNVVVIMLDRAAAEYVPYILKEKPELKEKLDGFTFYENTLSFGGHTNIALPALMGGYEYTPVEINKRSDELLVDKHNEALKVMPTLFSRAGYKITVCDAPYANYNWIPDLSIYDDLPDTDTYITKGYFSYTDQKKQTVESNMRNFFCFGVMKCLPLPLQNLIYDGGAYNRTLPKSQSVSQQVTDFSRAEGMSKGFLDSFEVLRNMKAITSVTEEKENHFLFLSNESTHEPSLLQTPDYLPAEKVDNTDYDSAHPNRFQLENGESLSVTKTIQMTHYHINMASLLQLADWFDYLRENGVYDNTRIILVSDHAYYLNQNPKMHQNGVDLSNFYPLLMVKDFDAKGFSVSDEFMTNADVPTLALKSVVENPVNPFTGKPINSDEKTAHAQYISLSHNWETNKNNGTTFAASKWVGVIEDLRLEENRVFVNRTVVLTENAYPRY